MPQNQKTKIEIQKETEKFLEETEILFTLMNREKRMRREMYEAVTKDLFETKPFAKLMLEKGTAEELSGGTFIATPFTYGNYKK